MNETPTVQEPLEPTPRILCDTRGLDTVADTRLGALWKLAETDRQLDANVIHLPAGERIDTHTEPDLDVLLLVLTGDGTLGIARQDRPQRLDPGMLAWLPHGSTRSVTAGENGLTYLTVHRRRPGMRIGSAPVAAS